MEQLHDHTVNEDSVYKKRLSIALKAARICVFEVDLTQQLYTFFENSEDIFGVSGDHILKDVQTFQSLSPEKYQEAVSNYFSHPDDADVINEAFISIFNGQKATYVARMKAGDSQFVWCKLDVVPIIENGHPVKLIGVITDISDIKRKNDWLKKQVRLDAYTGLYNKEYAIQLIKSVLHSASNQRHALILLDIDNFKHFNDTYGHYEGDYVIKSTATALLNSFREVDMIGRFGGDEFIVLVNDISSYGWLHHTLESLVNIQDDKYSSSNSIGVSIYPDDGETFVALFQNADKALYHAKRKRTTCTFFGDISKQE